MKLSRSVFAFVLVAVLAAGCKEEAASNSTKAGDTAKAVDLNVFDAAKLPRVSGAKEVFASPATTIFTSPDSVAQTADNLEKALTAGGWQKYAAPNSATANDPAMRLLSMKRGPRALSVYVSVAPAQNNATSVQYSELPLKTDLPFIKDAANIEYSPEQAILRLVTAEPADKALDFYRKELEGRGWSLWSEKVNGKQGPGGPSGMVHEKGGYAHYVTDKDPSVALVLTLQTVADGKSKLEIKQWPAGVLADEHRSYINSDNRNAPAVDVSRVVRLDGAQVVADRTTADQMVYSVPGAVPATAAAVRKLLAADGWKQYVEPLEENSSLLWFKKGRQGLGVSLTQTSGQPGQSSVYYSPKRLTFAVPFPADAGDVVYDDNRPYFGATTSGSAEATFDFFHKELTVAGWMPLSAADAAAKWPGAAVDDKAAYYIRGKDRVIAVTLKPRDGKIFAEVRVPPFARPQTVEFEKELFGLPAPELFKTSGGTGGDVRREVHAHIPAEVGPVLAFYRRELAARNWKEETEGAIVDADNVRIKFTSPAGIAALKIVSKYDLTLASIEQQVAKPATPAQPPARTAQAAPAPGDPIDAMVDQLVRDALGGAMGGNPPPARGGRPPVPPPVAADSADALKPLANSDTPVPVPDNAQDIDFADGKLEFTSPASVRAVADFYRTNMRQQGWQSQASPINNANMVVLNFSKDRNAVAFTIMRMGNDTNVSASGSALRTAARPGAPASARADTPSPAATADDLIVEESGGLPAPKRHTLMASEKTPFRVELTASVPLDLPTVLGFYRTELGKRSWKEDAAGAVTKADEARLAYLSPDGLAVLKLGRKDGETTVTLAVKNPDAAAKAGIKPAANQARVMFGNINDAEATITFNNRPFKVAPQAGTKGPDGPMLDVAPGKYKYSIRLPGRPVQTDEVEVGADETWGLMVGPGGVLPLRAY
jgi:hypothetical protein